MKNHKHRIFLLIPLLMVGCSSQPVTKPEPQVTQENLLDMVENQNLDRIRQLFGLDTDVNSTNGQGQSALHIASKRDLKEIAAVLLVRGANVNTPDEEGRTPLHLALEDDAKGVIPLLLQYKANIFSKNREEKRPVQLIFAKPFEMFRQFITAETLEQSDENGNTLLHYISEFGTSRELDLVLGVNRNLFNQRNLNGETPLDIALKKSQDLEKAKMSALIIEKIGSTPSDEAFRYFYEAVTSSNLKRVFEQGNTSLHFAAARNHLGIAKYLIQSGLEVNVRDQPGNTPLHRAIENSHQTMASFLLENKADINLQDFNSNAALHLALLSRNPKDNAQFLLSKGANPNLKNSFGNTPLHLVVQLGLPMEILELLQKAGADINSRNKQGNTPLMESIRGLKQELVKVLITLGGNIFASNNQDESPLTEAVKQGLEPLGWILNPKNIALRDDNGNTPLHLAILSKAEVSVVSFILNMAAPINERNKYGNSPLHVALELKNLPVTRLLIQNQADIFALNNTGKSAISLIFEQPLSFMEGIFDQEMVRRRDTALNTPLYYSIYSGALPVTNLLLERGALVQDVNMNQSTPLHEAVRNGQLEICKLLINKGANINSKDNQGNTPMHNVIFWESSDLADFLMSSGATLEIKNNDGRTPLHEGVRRGAKKMVPYLLTRGALINTRDSSGKTPLFDSVLLDDPNLLVFLLSRGANPQARDNNGNTVMHLAVTNETPGLIEILLNNGVDVFGENANGETPLMIALQRGIGASQQVINSKNINVQNNQGNSILHIAVLSARDNPTLEFILSLKPDINGRNKDGKTPLDLALEAKKKDFSDILLKLGAERGR